MEKKPATIDEYLKVVPDEARTALERLRKDIKSAAPELEEGIGWGMPAFKYRGRNLVGFAAFKDHCSLFPESVRVMEEFADELESFKTTKGTIHFSAEKPIPAALVNKLIKARIKESLEKQKGEH